MYDVDNANPLKRFFARKEEDQQVGEEAISTDPKVVPIKPPRPRLNPLRRISLAQLLVLPIAASGFYFYGVARDRFVTRSDFVIRKAEDAANADGGSLGSLLGRSNQLSLEDARFLKTYLQSPQVLNDLSRSYDIDTAYARDRRDPFAGITPGLSPEKRLIFFKKQVSVTLDELSGAIVLRTVGLNPNSSFELNRFMLAKSEQFVNRLNQDISLKQLSFAEAELRRSRANLEQAKNRLISYQNANAVVIDPKGEAELASVTISKLQERLVERKVELATLRRQYKDPREPEVLAIADEVRELEGQIAQERRSLVSSKGRNLNRKAADVVKLESDVSFATDTYKLALTSVEKARVESKRQQKFMALLSAPQIPEDPQNSWRIKGFFTVLASCVVLFSLTKFVLGMQASHRQ
jgi:capsular polysaccharide transport system permease protein